MMEPTRFPHRCRVSSYRNHQQSVGVGISCGRSTGKSDCVAELCHHDLVDWWVTLDEQGNDKQTERNIDALLLHALFSCCTS